MADATVTFGAKDLNLGSTIEKLKKELGATQGASRNAAKEFEMSFAKMAGAVAVGTAAFEAFKAAGTFGLSAVTSALSGIGSAFTKSIDAAAQMETLKTAFIPLLGSADAAQNRIEELAKFAASTPFELPEIAKASRTLETLTRGALATGDGLRLVGDIAAGTNQPFEEVATTIGRLYDGLQSGRPVGEAMQRLQELGAVSGETRTQIEELSKAGKNTEAWLVAEEALNRFNGSMQLQSGTWTGLLSTLSDNITNAYAKFGEPPAWAEYRSILDETGARADGGAPLALEPILKWDFYKQVESPDHVLTVQTADRALWANVLLTVGCRTD